MHTIRPNAARAKRVIIVFIVSVVLWILRSYQVYNYLYTFSDNEQFITALNYMVIGLNWAAGIVAILLMVVFIQWFRRAYYNLHQIPGATTSYGEGWAAGSWFVPIANVYRPYVIMKEIWVGTQDAVAHRIGKIAPPTIIGYWWGLYLFRIVFQLIVNSLRKSEYPPAKLDHWLSDVIIYLVGIVPLVLAIIVVKRVSSFEKELWEEAQTPSDSVFALEPGVSL